MKYLELCAHGQDNTACVAVENARGFTPQPAADVIEKGIAVRGNRKLPGQAHALEVAQELRSVLASAVAAARRHITVGTPLDPLLVASQGDYAIDSYA